MNLHHPLFSVHRLLCIILEALAYAVMHSWDDVPDVSDKAEN